MNVIVEISEKDANEIRRIMNGEGNFVTADFMRAMIPITTLQRIVGDGDPRFTNRFWECPYDGLAFREREGRAAHLVEAHGFQEGERVPALEPGAYSARLAAVEADGQMITWRMRLGFAGDPNTPMFKIPATDV